MTAPKPEGITSHRVVHESGVIYLDVGIQPHIANVIEGMEPWADKLVSDVNTIDTAIAERDATRRLYVEMSDHASALQAQADSLRVERDAAIARVGELEARLAKLVDAGDCILNSVVRGGCCDNVMPERALDMFDAALSAAKVGGAG